jgi:hypothetical protein
MRGALLFRAEAQMLNGIQNTMHVSLGGLLATTSLAGRDLFYIGILCSLPFIVFQLISSMNSGGGAGLIESIGFRIFAIFSMMALVTSWQPFANGLEADIKAFVGVVAAASSGVAVPDFTPDGVFAVYQEVEKTLYGSGNGSPFAVLDKMNLWKLFTIALIEFSGLISAFMLMLGNISLDLVFGICSFCVGFIPWPFMRSFADQFFGLIMGCAVFAIAVAAFVGIGETLALGAIGHGPLAATMAGPDMVNISETSFVFTVLAAIVPALLAQRIAGGGLITGMGEMLAFARRTIGK